MTNTDERDSFLHSLISTIQGPPATPEYFEALFAWVRATPQVEPDKIVATPEALLPVEPETAAFEPAVSEPYRPASREAHRPLVLSMASLVLMLLIASASIAVIRYLRPPGQTITMRPPTGIGVPTSPVRSEATIPKQGSATSGAPGEIVALSGNEVVLLDSATGRRIRVLAINLETAPATHVSLQGVALSADRRTAYYAVAGECGIGTVYRVPIDGGAPAERVATGISPALSPDGEKLAYAAPGGTAANGRPRCNNHIVVRDVSTGAERTWSYPDDQDHHQAIYQDGAITKIAWAPDSIRLAYTLSYDGDTVAVLDTVIDHDLSESQEVVVPRGGGDSRHPTWQASTGKLAVVNSAFECCYADDYTGSPRAILTDPYLPSPGEDLLTPGKKPTWLDFDLTGDHLLYVDEGTLYRRSGDSSPVVVGNGYSAADW